MIVDFREANMDALCDIYNRCLPAKYAIDSLLLRQHTVDSKVFDWGASCIEPGKAFVAVKQSPNRLFSGANIDTSYISVLGYQDPTLLLDLFERVKRCLSNRGVEKLKFGSDTGHFFPGCPTDWPSLSDFLLIGGFVQEGESHDLERDLIDYSPPGDLTMEYQFRPLSSEDLPSLKSFLVAEFPGRWHYDVIQKINDEQDAGVVFGMFEGGSCRGFALTQQDGCKTQIGGAVWKKDLGEAWCSLGPIGISKQIRGNGHGTALLAKALEWLRDSGGRRCIIDWTGLVEFYGRQGFSVSRTYRGFSLHLNQVSSR
jgi:GNAT superfamily N-acetyltransferase